MTASQELSGHVAIVTGADGGQGRSHVARFLREGADVLALDVKGPDEPREERHGEARLMRAACDVTDASALGEVVQMAVERFGTPTVVVANAGINGLRGPAWEFDDDEWDRLISINLSGVWRTVRAAIPHMLAGERGGSIVVIGSTCSVRGYPTTAHYTAAKHGLVGLTRVLAAELGPSRIRVNIVHPTTVDTDLIHNDSMYRAFVPPDLEPTRENFEQVCLGFHHLPIPWLQPEDVTEAVLWLASDRSRYVTSAEIAVDAGATQKT